MFDDLVRLVFPLFGMGVVALWIAGSFLNGILNHLRLHRALELRAAERIALVERGLDPRTLAPLSATIPSPGEAARG